MAMELSTALNTFAYTICITQHYFCNSLRAEALPFRYHGPRVRNRSALSSVNSFAAMDLRAVAEWYLI